MAEDPLKLEAQTEADKISNEEENKKKNNNTKKIK